MASEKAAVERLNYMNDVEGNKEVSLFTLGHVLTAYISSYRQIMDPTASTDQSTSIMNVLWFESKMFESSPWPQESIYYAISTGATSAMLKS